MPLFFGRVTTGETPSGIAVGINEPSNNVAKQEFARPALAMRLEGPFWSGWALPPWPGRESLSWPPPRVVRGRRAPEGPRSDETAPHGGGPGLPHLRRRSRPRRAAPERLPWTRLSIPLGHQGRRQGNGRDMRPLDNDLRPRTVAAAAEWPWPIRNRRRRRSTHLPPETWRWRTPIPSRRRGTIRGETPAPTQQPRISG